MKTFAILIALSSISYAQVEVAIMAGQSNMRTSVSQYYSYYGNQTGNIRQVETYFGGAGIELWVAESTGVYSRGPTYLERICDPGENVSLAEAALKQLPLPNKVSFLWMQGETDTETDERVSKYEDKLRALFNFISIDFATAPDFQKVIGLIWYSNPEVTMGLERTRRIYRIRTIQAKIAKEFGAMIVDTCGMPRFGDTPPSTDYVHISYPDGAVQFGWQLRQAILRKQDYRPESIKMRGTDILMNVVRGKRYQLLKSDNLDSWFTEVIFKVEYPANPISEVIQNTVPANRMFFQLHEIEP